MGAKAWAVASADEMVSIAEEAHAGEIEETDLILGGGPRLRQRDRGVRALPLEFERWDAIDADTVDDALHRLALPDIDRFGLIHPLHDGAARVMAAVEQGVAAALVDAAADIPELADPSPATARRLATARRMRDLRLGDIVVVQRAIRAAEPGRHASPRTSRCC